MPSSPLTSFFISAEKGRIAKGDTLIFIDFRADRMREISRCFGVEPEFDTGDDTGVAVGSATVVLV
jgi:bisphosphoglycerate-independent phosphoglycerate mutase (AlkP superfamily)